MLDRLWRWLTTPHKDRTAEDLKLIEAESERKASLATLPEPPDFSDDPDTDVPGAHLGQARRSGLSDWDLLSPQDKALFEQATPHDPEKVVRYPAPVEQPTADWVTDQLKKAGYSSAYGLRFAALRRVGIGMSMRHLGDLKRRAEARDESLSVHDLIALRQRGIS